MIGIAVTPRLLLISVIAAIIVGFGGGWLVQGWRLGNEIEKQKLEHAKELIQAQEEAAKTTATLQKGVDDAKKSHAVAVATINQLHETLEHVRLDVSRLQADSARLRRDAGGLRDQLARYREGANASHAACLERVATFEKLAGDSSDLLVRGAQVVAGSSAVVERGRSSLTSCARDHQLITAGAAALIEGWPKDAP